MNSFLEMFRATAYLAGVARSALYMIVEEVPGWVPPMRDKKRFASKLKRYFADPSLAVASRSARLWEDIEVSASCRTAGNHV